MFVRWKCSTYKYPLFKVFFHRCIKHLSRISFFRHSSFCPLNRSEHVLGLARNEILPVIRTQKKKNSVIFLTLCFPRVNKQFFRPNRSQFSEVHRFATTIFKSTLIVTDFQRFSTDLIEDRVQWVRFWEKVKGRAIYIFSEPTPIDPADIKSRL